MNDNKSILFGDMLRGYTDKIILSTIENEDLYGYRINKILELKTNQTFYLNEATLYTTFQRLEKAGYITSYWSHGDSLPKKKYYSITKDGIQYLNQSKKEWHRTRDIIDLFLS
ncbi:MAG: PadR family transcriptional regulator [Candidatus Izemoplasmatales bacterium]|jgi:DNA-binding PadR family transcriptional regulator|nr:PadR family transcriptional regulator [Candidatus Izemoplasmatales bacterium]